MLRRIYVEDGCEADFSELIIPDSAKLVSSVGTTARGVRV